jgi:hypothetical protein
LVLHGDPEIFHAVFQITVSLNKSALKILPKHLSRVYLAQLPALALLKHERYKYKFQSHINTSYTYAWPAHKARLNRDQWTLASIVQARR